MTGIFDALAAWAPTLASKYNQGFTYDCVNAADEGITLYYEDLGALAGRAIMNNPVSQNSMTIWARITLTSNSTKRDPGRSSYNLGMKKTMMHEIGHTVGLDDSGGPCGSQSSVMNTFCNIKRRG